jgi:hypothetical protein
MPDVDVLLYFSAEIALVSLFVCVFLLLHVNRQKKLAVKLADKIRSLRGELQLAKKASAAPIQQPVQSASSYQDVLDLLLDETLDYYSELAPSGNISLDIGWDVPLERQVCALRYAFFLAEKEAVYAGEQGKASWPVLQQRLKELFALYQREEARAEPPLPTMTGSDDSELLTKKIVDMQQEMLNLKTRYIELEDRYQELQGGS